MRRIAIAGALLLLAIGPASAQRRPPANEPQNPYNGNAEAVSAGEKIYNQNCTTCHGVNGGSGIIAPAIVNPGAATFRGQRTDYELLQKIRNGVPNTPMPAWKGRLSDDDILKIGAYIHALRGTAIDSPVSGDATHGQEIFFGKGGCSKCHMIWGKGGLIGPDLTNVAGTLKTVNIQNALTKAEHRIWLDGGEHLSALPPMDTYDHVRITLKDGKKLEGALLNQDSFSIQMMGMDDQLHLLDRARIANVEKLPPLMPTDVDKQLTAAEFTDLMAFLTRQGVKPPAQAASAGGAPSPD